MREVRVILGNLVNVMGKQRSWYYRIIRGENHRGERFFTLWDGTIRGTGHYMKRVGMKTFDSHSCALKEARDIIRRQLGVGGRDYSA